MIIMNNNMGRNKGILSVASDAKVLISKIDKLIKKIDSNGLRLKVVKIWPLTLDIRIKNND
tara:strand:- start:233 stop:415 length:183 start_codon:yes stop_codon:yes gene_type:complete